MPDVAPPAASAGATPPPATVAPPKNRDRLAPDRVAAITELAQAGHQAKAIAQQLNLPVSTVAYYVRKAAKASAPRASAPPSASAPVPPALAALWAEVPAPGPWPERDCWLAAMTAVTTFYFPDPEEAASHE